MKNYKKYCGLLFLIVFLVQASYSQTDTVFKAVSLNDLSDFADPPSNWAIASDAEADFTKSLDLHAIKGTGTVVNDVSKNGRMHLYTKEEFGDVEVSLDFMMAKNSNSGVYLQGRYEVQLLDSWTRLNPTTSDEGAIYSRWSEQRGSYEGTPPYMNVSRAPGLWQNLHLKFRAPQFDASGNKIKNARFEEVYLNGVLVQQATDVTGPTTSSMYNDEKSLGSLVLQGDHGPVAFKNIRYRRLTPFADSILPVSDRTYWEQRNPIIITPGLKNYVLRSFMDHGNEKLTHIISVGSPSEVNFTYNLKEGTLIKAWRGKFLDATRMWYERGEPQLAVPLGSVINFRNEPSLAVLTDANSVWPALVAFDDLQPQGYSLSHNRNPVFSYMLYGINVRDSIGIMDNGEGIIRTITVANPSPGLYCRLANGTDIIPINDSLYTVNGRSFYIMVDKKYNAVIRNSGREQELLIKYDNNMPIVYSLIW